MLEPITSLIQREMTILSKNFGHLGRTSWELSRLLLRAREEYGKMALTQGELGAELRRSVPPAVVDSCSVPDEPALLQRDWVDEFGEEDSSGQD